MLAYNLANFLRQLALPRSVRHWSLTTLKEKLIKIGAKVVRHSRYAMFQMAEVAVPRDLFAAILARIKRVRFRPRWRGQDDDAEGAMILTMRQGRRLALRESSQESSLQSQQGRDSHDGPCKRPWFVLSYALRV